MKSKFALAVLVLAGMSFSHSSFAYIPKYKTIASRLTDNRGGGVYLIDQTVTLFGALGEPIAVQEQWLVDGGTRMRMRARTRGDSTVALDITYIYDSSKKSYVTGEGKRTQVGLSSDWSLEPIFYFRNSTSLNQQLVRLKILTSAELAEDRVLGKKDNFAHKSDSFVRLSRADGTVSYAVGPDPGSTTDFNLPGLWIEQDSFLLKKLRLISGVTLNARKYLRHEGNLWLPQEREILWGENRAMIEVTGVKSVGGSAATNQRFSATSLNLNEEPHLASKLPEVAVIKDFYSRFR